MENQKSSSLFHQFWNWHRRNHTGGDQTGSQENPDGVISQSRIQDIERAEQANRAALTQRAERLCAAQKARTNSVLERLGLSPHVTLPSPQPSGLPTRSSKFCVGGRSFCRLLDGSRLIVEDTDTNQRSWDEQDDHSFWDNVLLGSYMAALECEMAPVADGDRSPTASISPVNSLSSVDTRTPSELSAIPLIGSPVEFPPSPPLPPPPPRAAVPLTRRRVSRLPVLITRLSGKDKEVVNESGLQTSRNKVEDRLEHLHIDCHPSPRPPAAPQKTPVMTPLVPTPPKAPQTQRRGSRPGTFLRPAQAVSAAAKKTEASGDPKSKKDKRAEVQPLRKPMDSLCLCFSLLSSDDWMKKIKGLETVKALAQHHSETLKTKLHEVCLVLIEEVKNLRSAVACAAMDTLAELCVHLQKAMDPEVEGTGRALLLKLAQTTNAFIHQQANLALDAMVENCSHGRTVSALLNTAMSHRCAAVRSSMARHLHQLADRLGAAHILSAGRTFTERFLIAVSKMSVDAAPDVRHHGQMILQDLALHGDFLRLWTKIVPEKERRPLDKILKKVKMQR